MNNDDQYLDDQYLQDRLHQYADVLVTDSQVDQAHTEFRARIDATTAPHLLPTRGLVAAAAALVVVAGGLWWHAAAGPDAEGPPSPAAPTAPAVAPCLAPGQVPSYSASQPDPGDNVIGDPVENPPVDARCRLVLRNYSHPNHGASQVAKVWLFSDGRLISWADGRPIQEQRLTPEGVEQVRRMAVDLLTDVRPAPRPANNGRLLTPPEVSYQGTTYWSSDYHELSDRLYDPSWLPASAWQREQPQPYQPDWWNACYGGTWSAVDPQRVLDRLPEDAAALLRGKDTTTVQISWDSGYETGETIRYCTVVSALEKQAVADALDHAGFTQARDEVTRLGRVDHRLADIAFEPLLPNGEGPGYGG